MSEVRELFPDLLEALLKGGRKKSNPCLAVFGPGPEEETCAGCVHLFAHWTNRKFFKCDLRRFSHGPATDHRARWPACGRFERRSEAA